MKESENNDDTFNYELSISDNNEVELSVYGVGPNLANILKINLGLILFKYKRVRNKFFYSEKTKILKLIVNYCPEDLQKDLERFFKTIEVKQ